MPAEGPNWSLHNTSPRFHGIRLAGAIFVCSMRDEDGTLSFPLAPAAYINRRSTCAGCERLFARLYSISPSKPTNRCEHSAPRDKPRRRTDLDGMRQNAQAREYVVPIVVGFVCHGPNGDQRQRASNGVAHVCGNSVEAVKEGEYAECCSRNLLARGKVRGEQRGNQQLKDGSSPEVQRVTEVAEEEMSAFMNRQVNVVKQSQLSEILAEIEEK